MKRCRPMLLAVLTFVSASVRGAGPAVPAATEAPAAPVAAVAAVAADPAMPTLPTTGWYPVTQAERPFVRWWWPGSAVDEEGLTAALEAFAAKGIGGVEITPIYGVQGNEANDIDYLSPRWMAMLRHTQREGARLGVQIDMSNCTGWPFGGAWTDTAQSACKLIAEQRQLNKGDRIVGPLVPQDPRQREVATLERVVACKGDRHIDLTAQFLPNNHTPHISSSLHTPHNPQIPQIPKSKLRQTNTKSRVLRGWRVPDGGWRVWTLFCGRTFQKVKRAAPGGEGLVLNHYDRAALEHYLARFDEAFAADGGTPWPETFFNDSFEVYGADWDPQLLAAFEQQHGYKLEAFLPEFFAAEPTDLSARVVTDYRATLAELLLHNFTEPWAAWARARGIRTRNQAHGSPGNLIDLYAAVDIPECESFGQSPFPIPGLHRTGPRRPNDSDRAVLKFASSAAHLTGKRHTSAEALTWLTEHFSTTLALCKPELDQLFAAGVNRVCFHGAPYSPVGAAFPGWMFYASINLTPHNTIWHDADALFDYATRCQSFLSAGEPDGDFLLYLPLGDIWHEQQERPLLLFDIHTMERTMPRFLRAARTLLDEGYDCDYLSDRLLQGLTVEADGTLCSAGGTRYRALVVPECRLCPAESMARFAELAEAGATIVFAGSVPEDVPGLGRLEERRALFAEARAKLPDYAETTTVTPCGKGRIITGSDYAPALAATGVRPEPFAWREGAYLLRRTNEAGRKNYFIALTGAEGLDGWVAFNTAAAAVEVFDPVTGRRGMAQCRPEAAGSTGVRLQLPAGGSLLLKFFDRQPEDAPAPWPCYEAETAASIPLDRGWQLDFTAVEPTPVQRHWETDRLLVWTELPDTTARVCAGTARYTVRFTVEDPAAADEWELDLGDVRESARVRVNGCEAGTAWCVPFRLRIGSFLRAGRNELEIDVTNLPANRIADMERRGVRWRIFKDANIASVTGAKNFSFGDWETVPSGLSGPVTLTPLKIKEE